MANVPEPESYLAGEFLTSSKLNRTRDLLEFLLRPPRAKVSKVGAQTMQDGQWDYVRWDRDNGDPQNMWDPGYDDSALIVRTPGWWRFDAAVTFGTTARGGGRSVRMRLDTGNGVITTQPSTYRAVGAHPSSASMLGTTLLVPCENGAVVRVEAQQRSGGVLQSISTSTYRSSFTAEWIGAL